MKKSVEISVGECDEDKREYDCIEPEVSFSLEDDVVRITGSANLSSDVYQVSAKDLIKVADTIKLMIN